MLKKNCHEVFGSQKSKIDSARASFPNSWDRVKCSNICMTFYFIVIMFLCTS